MNETVIIWLLRGTNDICLSVTQFDKLCTFHRASLINGDQCR